uniref:Uncharacterized protein n=1 Tax=Tanacetum cinerariifolium TaxID=118510 RepID=A0A6L2P4S8_TANCI|nr:hypothetical protein [Tanacetum cinerariifolium]
MLKSFPLPVMKIPLLEYLATASEEVFPLLKIEQPNPTFAKILILDTGKFEQWKFRIQQYLQNEHYALWEVIEFGDSYETPPEELGTGSASESSDKKKGRTVSITTEDMQKRRNDVKARTTLLLALPDEHQLSFSKYETTQELWGAILKTFGGNEATKKTKKNQLKQQYGNFKAKGSETLEQTFNRLAPRSQDRGWDWGYMANEEENHALVADDKAPTEFALMAKSSSSSKNEEIKFCEKIRGLEFNVKVKNNKIENLMNEVGKIKKEKEGLDSKLTGFESASKDLDTLLGSQKTDKNKEGLRYNVVSPPPPAQVYSPPKKDIS